MINSRNLIYTNILDLTSKHPLEMTLLLFKVSTLRGIVRGIVPY